MKETGDLAGHNSKALTGWKPHGFVLLVWICFLARGFFYSSFSPIWEGYDEWAHFAYVQHLITHADLPLSTQTRVSREVEESLNLTPLPWTLRYLPAPSVTHDAFWKVSVEEQRRRQERLASLPFEWSRRDAQQQSLLLYEAQQPPLYYWLLSWPLRVTGRITLSSRVLLLRYVSVGLASLVVPLTYLIALRVFRKDGPALGTTAVVASMPELMIDVCRVGNESLAIVVYSLLLYVSLKITEDTRHRVLALTLGLILGLGLLTKAYFLTALPALVVILGWNLWRCPNVWRRILLNAVIAAVIAVSISGWWYWRNKVLTGSWSGQQFDVALAGLSPSELLVRVPQVAWRRAVDSIFVSHIWFGNWSFLHVRSWIYRTLNYIVLLAMLGLVIFLVKGSRDGGSPPPAARNDLLLLVAFYACFWLGLAYHILITFAATGVSASTGWYMYSLVTAEVLLATTGLFTLFKGGVRRGILPGATTCFALLDLYATHFLSIPYYTGLISHKPSGALEAFYVTQLKETGLDTVLLRLQVNKPGFLTSAVLASAWFSYLASTLGLVTLGLVFSCGKRFSRPLQPEPLNGGEVHSEAKPQPISFRDPSRT